MANVIRGRSSGTRFRGYLEGGPELARRLQELEKSVRDDLLVQAMDAGAEVIETEWRSRVMGTWGTGPGSAHYVAAIGHNSRPGKRGATAYVGLPNEQSMEPGESHPREYAPRLEFAGKPTLRPAFDAAQGKAQDAIAAKVRDLIERVADLG